MTERRTLTADFPELVLRSGDEINFGLELRHANQRIMLGDCLPLLKSLERNSIDVVVTSPPYNIGTSYRSTKDCMPHGEYLEWLGLLARELDNVLTEKGSIFLNMDGCARMPWQAYEVAEVFRKRFTLQNEIAWIKSISIEERTFGHFKPINSNRFLNRNCEKIFHFSKQGYAHIDRLAIGVPYQDKSNISRWGGARKDLRCGGNVWFVPYPTVRSKAQRANHPASFPVELARRCLRLAGNKGKVLDPFVGTGSTLVAAQELGMEGIGMEIDAEYAWAAYERLGKAFQES